MDKDTELDLLAPWHGICVIPGYVKKARGGRPGKEVDWG